MSTERRALLIVVLTPVVLVAGPAGTVGTAGHGESLGLSQVSAVAPADDGWWVLERSLRGGGGVVYRYTAGWEPTGKHHRLSLDRRRGFSPVDLARTRDGGWWVLGSDGRVYRFAADWTATGESHAVPEPYFEGNVTSGFGLARSRGGGWWVAAGRELFRTTEEWTVPDGSINTIGSRTTGYPVAAAYGPGGGLWVLEGFTGRGVVRLPLTADGDAVSSAATRTAFGDAGPSEVAVPDREYPVAEVVDVPVDVARVGDRYWVVDGNGQVHQFDRYWRYTGVTRAVGSGETLGYYPPDAISPLVVLVPLLRALPFVPGLLVLVGSVFQTVRTPDPSVAVGGAAGLVFVYGVVSWPHAVRPAVFLSVHLPLVVTIAALVGPPVHLYRLAGDGRRFRSLLPLAVAYLVVVAAAVTMLGPAVRVFGG